VQAIGRQPQRVPDGAARVIVTHGREAVMALWLQ